MSKWSSIAPSNIALIKYMGKTNHQTNIASSPSLSLTLNHLLTFVEVELSTNRGDQWEPLTDERGLIELPELGLDFLRRQVDLVHFQSPQLTQRGQNRYLEHWQKVKNFFDIQGCYTLRSASNFPSDCGVASSASSFAALTLAGFQVAQKMGSKNLDASMTDLANLSRQASGSSCRSFFAPWCLWQGDQVSEFKVDFQELVHDLVVVEAEVKKVSSSEAHRRISTSLLNMQRSSRVDERMVELKELLKQSLDSKEVWKKLFELCWAEFWDMHALFETSSPPFGYMTPGSLEVLRSVQKVWEEFNDGPIVTMDAGANVHLIYKKDQTELRRRLKKSLGKWKFISSHSWELT